MPWPGTDGLRRSAATSFTLHAGEARPEGQTGQGFASPPGKISGRIDAPFLPLWGFFPALKSLNWADTPPKLPKVIVRRAYIA